MNGRIAADGAHHDFGGVERFAAQRPRGGHVVNKQRRDAVGMKSRAERAQQLDRHSRPVAQHLLGGRVGEQNLPWVDDEHRLRHAVKGAPQHGGRKLSSSWAATRCSVRSATAASSASLVAWVALSESCSSRRERRVDSVRTVARIRISATPARSIASRNVPLVSIRAPREKQPALFRHRLCEVSGDRGRRRAVILADECCDGRAVSRGPEPDQLAIDRNLALHQRLGLFDQLLFGGIVLDGFDQCRERRQDRVAGLAIFLANC